MWTRSQERCSKDSSSNPALEQLDWTASRVLVVRPGVVGATTGAGVGLPLLLFVVIFFSSQTHAAVTLLNITSISTPSPSTTRRYLTATTTTTKTTSDILWKPRDVFNDKFNKPRQPLGLQSPSSSSSSSSLEIFQRRNEPGNRWFELPENFRVLEPLGWKGSLEGGQDQIHSFDRGRRRKTNLDREDLSKGGFSTGKVPRQLYPVRTDQLEVPGNVGLGDLSNLRGKPRFHIRTTSATSRTSETEQAVGSVRESEVVEKTERGGSIGKEETERARNSGVVQVQVKNVSGEITTSVDVFVGDSSVEWTTATTVAGPMSSLSYPGEAQGAGRVRNHPGQKQRRPEEEVDEAKVTSEGKNAGSSSSTIASTTTQAATTELPPPTRDTSMEARKWTRTFLLFLF